ncbi:hypothetical protein BC834DRAFT_860526 [Gloeopeniophorella convolvens]|nr:hypothetical protein BC834DRAFT_860526 [Gloeopeniophorella convolvens]
MSLIKVPVLVAAALSFQIAFTPPAPPSKKGEQKIAEDKSWVIKLVERTLNKYALAPERVVIVGGLLAEAVANYALAAPESPTSKMILGFYGWRSESNTLHLWTSLQFVIGMLLCAIGIAIRKLCFLELGRHFTFEVAILDDHKLVTTGPYSIVRHPSYTGGALIVLGILIGFWSPGSWWMEGGTIGTVIGKVVIAVWMVKLVHFSVILSRAPTEDVVLHKEFGKVWEEYAARVPYLYVPGVL